MGSDTKAIRIAKLVTLSVGVAAAFGVWNHRDYLYDVIFSKNDDRREVLEDIDRSITDDDIIKILRQIVINQYETLYEISQTSHRVLLNLEARNMRELLCKYITFA